MTKTIHVRLDIRGALLNWSDRMFHGMFKTDDGHTMTEREAKLQLMEELTKGHNYIPYGDCPGFDPVEKGCPGHGKDLSERTFGCWHEAEQTASGSLVESADTAFDSLIPAISGSCQHHNLRVCPKGHGGCHQL